jgi:serine protease Do
MSVNGIRQPIDAQGTKPIIVESRTLVPIRAIIEALGGSVAWDADTQKVTVTFGENTLELWIGQPSASLNGYYTSIDPSNSEVFPIVISGRTMIPLRFVAESLGIDVQYENDTKMITLTYTIVSAPPVVQTPSEPVLISPATGSNLNDSNITFTWSSVTGADSYRLQIVKDNSTVYSANNITLTNCNIISGTISGGTYSWQVAAHNSAGWSSWSSSFTFSINTQMSITDIAKFVDRVVYIEVNGIEDGKSFVGKGSGFIISSDGRIVTNYHVIDYATTGTVTLNNKQTYNIDSILGYDKNLDLAVIKIDTTGLPYCTLGDSSKIEVGESVVAIGNPLGYQETQNTVSNGIVSKIWDDRTIQTTAPISPGSSGGPLFDMYGEVIGTIFAKVVNGENMNLAIPINKLQSVSTSSDFTLQQIYEKEHGAVATLPGTPSLISPTDESVLTTMTPTLNWTPVSGADYYGVWVGKGRIADDQYKIWYQNVTGTSVEIPAGILSTGQQYTWAVCAHNSVGFGSWSDNWHFSTVNTPSLTPPLLLSPDDKESLLENQLSFSWTSVPGAVAYGFWVGLGLSGDPSTEVYRKTVSGTSFTMPEGTLTEGKIYTWAVCAIDNNSNTIWSIDRHFSLIETNSPTLIYPTNYSTIYINPTMIWLSMYGATSYKLVLYEGSMSNSNIIFSEQVNGTQYTLPVYIISNGKTYYWFIGAYSGEYIIGISNYYMFNVAP